MFGRCAAVGGITTGDWGEGSGGFRLRRAVRLAGGLIALEVEVLDPVPTTIDVHIADDLLALGLGAELHGLFARGAFGRVAGFDVAQGSAARALFDRDSHAVLSARPLSA